ncbi:HNH endonuclease [Prauserella flavalba]|uniref:HNH endonuclease n=1 Tax=Prauserella flavalba TaxID=1477506 RepID=UPI0036EB508D
MSKTWKGGSSRAQRAARAFVLDRDAWVCQLCGKPIPRAARTPHPDSAEAHHTVARELVGDNPEYMVASHRRCNQKAGDPRVTDPQPRPRTKW